MKSALDAVAWIISPINVLQCLIAHRCLETYTGQKINLRLLHYYPTDDADLSKGVFEIVQKIAHSADCSITHIEKATDISIQSKLSSDDDIDYIFFAHDVVGNLFEYLQSLYPHAQTVCYGDALGQYFQKEVHLGFLQQRSFLKMLFQPKSPPKDFAILTIPVSQARLPRSTKLLVPTREDALSLVTSAAENDFPLISYCRSLLEKNQGSKLFFFPIENMAEGNFITSEKEMELYSEAIEKNCPHGSTIIIKPHPGEQFDRMDLFKNRLGKSYNFEIIDPAFKRYPIELFTPLLEKCRIISMFYPVLSLKYLYDIDVIQPMTNDVIEKYFEPRFWASYKNAVKLNMAPLKRLQKWDGKSLLYNGY